VGSLGQRSWNKLSTRAGKAQAKAEALLIPLAFGIS
jgi:hypothetical protein